MVGVDLDEVISRLEALQAIIGHRGTGGAAEYEAVKGLAVLTPFIHVIPVSERPLKRDDLLTVVESIAAFDVIYTVRNVKDAQGHAGYAELRQLRGGAWNALLGWTPAGMAGPLAQQGGRLLFMGNGVLQWADNFGCLYLHEYELQT